MKTYELTYIISPEITLEEAEAKARELGVSIQDKGGIILKQGNPIAKTLAFPIAKKASGFLGSVEFQTEAEKIVEIAEAIKKDGKIVRHMLIIKETPRVRKQKERKILSTEAFVAEKKEISTEESPVEETKEKKPAEETLGHSQAGEAAEKIEEEKVELKDIEKKLDEILG